LVPQRAPTIVTVQGDYSGGCGHRRELPLRRWLRMYTCPVSAESHPRRHPWARGGARWRSRAPRRTQFSGAARCAVESTCCRARQWGHRISSGATRWRIVECVRCVASRLPGGAGGTTLPHQYKLGADLAPPDPRCRAASPAPPRHNYYRNYSGGCGTRRGFALRHLQAPRVMRVHAVVLLPR
jgi:hypothetical protein